MTPAPPSRPFHDGVAATARVAYAATAIVFVACLVVQVLLVGVDAFVAGDEATSVHRDFAYAYGWLVAVLVLLASLGRLPRRLQLLTGLLLLLFATQTALPGLAGMVPFLGGLHAVNALALLWLAGWLAVHAHQFNGGRIR